MSDSEKNHHLLYDKNPLTELALYRERLTLSQAIEYFNRQGLTFTKTMVQNYVRIGLLPPPEDKRYYTRGHMARLALIDLLKSAFSLEEISAVFPWDSGKHSDEFTFVYNMFEKNCALAQNSVVTRHGEEPSMNTLIELMTLAAAAKELFYRNMAPFE